MNDNKDVNLDVFRDYAAGDSDEELSMAGLFVEQSQVYYNELCFSFEANLIQEWHDIAHKFKGMSGFAGAERLRSACLRAQEGVDLPRNEKKQVLDDILVVMNDAINVFRMSYQLDER